VFAVPKSIANSRPARDPNLTTDPKPSDALPWGPGLSPVVHRRSGRRSAELEPVPHVPTAFGEDAFGRRAEKAARFFGTPQYILGQSLVVVAWIAVNAVAVSLRWDPYPFILLNLAFSTQAAYAAPLILLAQTRQADRDKMSAIIDAKHRESLAERGLRRERMTQEGVDLLKTLIEENTALTQQINKLTREIHRKVA
jgi:uncharacterized membrane protein